MTTLAHKQLSTLREQLDERAKVLGAEVREAERERVHGVVRSPIETVEDIADQGEQRTREVVRLAEEERDAAELRAIDAAFGRMDEGCYGVCIDCDADIPLPRLLVQPTAARCIECQARYEKAHPPALRATPLL